MNSANTTKKMETASTISAIIVLRKTNPRGSDSSGSLIPSAIPLTAPLSNAAAPLLPEGLPIQRSRTGFGDCDPQYLQMLNGGLPIPRRFAPLSTIGAVALTPGEGTAAPR